MLKRKTVVLGVTGSIAAYKAASLASALVKEGADVHVIMTKNALNFINPITFETLTNNKCLIDTFDRNFQFHVAHISLAQQADVIMVAPASANIIGKAANGIADDMLSTVLLAAGCKIMIAPAMNTNMLKNAAVCENLKTLKRRGFEIIEPASGRLACGDEGAGKLPEPEILLEYIKREIQFEKDMKGLNVLVTAGPTAESIDPVRYITNHSTGKMGYALAETAAKRGAKVTLVSGKTNLEKPLFAEVVDVESAEDMHGAVMSRAEQYDILVKAAAVADYTPKKRADEKIKKSSENFRLDLVRTKDILKDAGEKKKGAQVICGFSMETDDLIENSKKKLTAKNCDMIVANSLREKGAGFGADTNVISIITKEGTEDFGIMSKTDAAFEILSRALEIRRKKEREL